MFCGQFCRLPPSWYCCLNTVSLQALSSQPVLPCEALCTQPHAQCIRQHLVSFINNLTRFTHFGCFLFPHAYSKLYLTFISTLRLARLRLRSTYNSLQNLHTTKQTCFYQLMLLESARSFIVQIYCTYTFFFGTQELVIIIVHLYGPTKHKSCSCDMQ